MTTPVDTPPADVAGAEFLTFDVDEVDVEVLAAGDGKPARREVAGLALPYGVPINRPHYATGARRQSWAPGSVVWRDNAALFHGHDHLNGERPIGRIVSSKDGKDGNRARARFADTPKADEVYALAKPDEDDGKAVLNRFSVGFYPVGGHLEEDGDLYVHDHVDAFDLSLTHDPALTGAAVDNVLNRTTPPRKETPMPETLELTPELLARLEGAASADDVQTLSTSINDLERRIGTLGASVEDGAPAVPFASYGEFLQATARGETEALEFLAYVGGTTDDLGEVMKDSWVGDRFKTIEAQRTALNFFARSPLPASGMGIEYGVEGTDTTQVDEQLAEGDVLPYGKVTFDTAHAPLRTFGGWGELSRQEIERSPINVVERFFNALLRRYAKETEAAVNARAVAGGVALTGGITDMATVDGWTRFVIRAARQLKDTGYPLEAILVGFDVFEDLALLRDASAVDNGERFLNRASGSVQITGMGGDVFNVPIVPIETGATTDVIRAANSEAIRTYEAGGAPFRLQDDDITNLTKAFSIYGYMVDVTEVPGAILKPQTV